MSVAKNLNYQLEDYSDKEIEAEFYYRHLGSPYGDEVSIQAFTDEVIFVELKRRKYKYPDENLAQLLMDSVAKNFGQMAEGIRNYIYKETGKLFKIEIA